MVALPIRHPFGNAGLDVFRISEELHFAAFAQGAQTFDGRSQFHAIIGGGRFRTADFLALLAVFEDRGPAAGTGIALAGTVAMNCYALHRADIKECEATRQAKAQVRN